LIHGRLLIDDELELWLSIVGNHGDCTRPRFPDEHAGLVPRVAGERVDSTLVAGDRLDRQG
jgi:hypothetical protein